MAISNVCRFSIEKSFTVRLIEYPLHSFICVITLGCFEKIVNFLLKEVRLELLQHTMLSSQSNSGS